MAQVSSKLHAQIEKVRDIIGRELELLEDKYNVVSNLYIHIIKTRLDLITEN